MDYIVKYGRPRPGELYGDLRGIKGSLAFRRKASLLQHFCETFAAKFLKLPTFPPFCKRCVQDIYNFEAKFPLLSDKVCAKRGEKSLKLPTDSDERITAGIYFL